jgi:hypothetical protein
MSLIFEKYLGFEREWPLYGFILKIIPYDLKTEVNQNKVKLRIK